MKALSVYNKVLNMGKWINVILTRKVGKFVIKFIFEIIKVITSNLTTIYNLKSHKNVPY